MNASREPGAARFSMPQSNPADRPTNATAGLTSLRRTYDHDVCFALQACRFQTHGARRVRKELGRLPHPDACRTGGRAELSISSGTPMPMERLLRVRPHVQR